MRFHKIKRDELAYCGPAAVRIITGWPASKVNDTFRAFRRLHGPRYVMTAHGPYHSSGSMEVRGTSPHEVSDVLRVFGYKMRGARDDSAANTRRRLIESGRMNADMRKPTFRAWARARQHRDRMYLVITSNHWMLVKGNRWMDGGCTEPQSFARTRLARGRVRAVYRIIAPQDWARPVYRRNTRRGPAVVNGRVQIG